MPVRLDLRTAPGQALSMRLSTTRRQTRRAAPQSETAWSTARFILTLAVLAWLLRSLIIAPFSIPSGSMLPTLFIGDYLIVAKWPYGYSSASFPWGFPPLRKRLLDNLPKRGDVVVFRHPVEDADLIKRVIALPGDTIGVRDGTVLLNGRPLVRRPLPPFRLPISANSPCKAVPGSAASVGNAGGHSYCFYPAFREWLPDGANYVTLDQVPNGLADNFPATRVPAGHVFLMGDNRDDSLDSRFPTAEGGIAMVPMEQLIGRATVTFWSTDGSASYFKPWTWFTALRLERLGSGYSSKSE